MNLRVKSLLAGALSALSLSVAAQELPTITPARETSYGTVAKYLNPGGTFYLYLSTDEWAVKLDRLAGALEGMVMPSLKGTRADAARAGFEILHRFIMECGLAELEGIGLSSVPIAGNLHHNRIIMQRTADDAGGIYWEMFGGENTEFALLDRAPANTALAFRMICRVKPLWNWVTTAVRESGSAPLIAGFERFLQQSHARGIPIDDWINSLGYRIALVITVDPETRIPLPPRPNQERIELPGIAIALLLEVRDDTLFEFVEAKLGAKPGLQRIDTASLRARVIPAPLPPPVQPTIARFDDYFVLSSSLELVRTLAQGKGGLRETQAFQKLAANLPKTGTGFSYVGPAFGQTIAEIMQTVTMAPKRGPAAMAGAMQKLFAGMTSQTACGVSLATPDGLLTLSNTNFDYGQTLVAQATVFPLAVGAGMLLPALQQASANARRTMDMSNLKQIGVALHTFAAEHDGNFPDDLGALMENNYVTAGKVFICPTSDRRPPANADELRAGRCDYVYFGKGRSRRNSGPDVPIACTKPGLLGRQAVNVLYGDGHVERHAAPPANVRKLLEEAGVNIPRGRAGRPARPARGNRRGFAREMGYQRVAGRKLAEVLAAKHPDARVLLVAGPGAAPARNPRIAGLKEGLEGMTIVDTVSIQVPPAARQAFAAKQAQGKRGRGNRPPPLNEWFTEASLNEKTAAYRGKVDLVVTAIGLPAGEGNLWFWEEDIPVALANGSVYELREMIETGLITAAVADKPGAARDELPVPADPNVAFDKRYLLLTPETVVKTAGEYPGLFRR